MIMLWLTYIIPSSVIIMMKHPLSMGLILLLQTTLITMITSMMNLSSWFSYIMFLVMIGGMLVLFMYMTSVASNEKFKFSINLFLFMSIITSILIFSQITTDPALLFLPLTINESILFQKSYIDSINKYLNNPSITVSSTLILYLLITMIAIIKIINIKNGPLRHKN
uniref:NADH-ubiquinone oxidoreductase chain 6 n=1 Tax=Cheironitis sp. MJTNT-2012 TaxID=2558026 RepID=S4SUM7_9SCAR|nr:NADH dehydrogenase subunit 6 [Aegus fukiensis]AFQ62175.1 NADH dehydrogenase subunit 6 [Cheironitis sp. MJTNT-2012]WQB61572.1 NADH dehydrogenase subunit 6 [Aegus fukiensis]